jgi:DNA-binding beta-propeller fold protein YncE
MKRFEFLRLMSAAMITTALSATAHAGPPDSVSGTDTYLLVADFNRDSVKRYDSVSGAFVDTFVPKHSGGMNQPWGVLFGPHDGDLYVSTGEFGGPGQVKGVLRYDGTTGAFIDNFAVGGNLASPRGIIFGPDGNLYVADRKYIGQDWQLEGRVARFDGTTGAYLGEFVPLGSGGLSIPTQLVFGPSVEDAGRLDLYVVSTGTNSVLRYDGTTGNFLGEFVASGNGGLEGPVTMTFGPDGDLYVADFYSTDLAVKRFEGPSGLTPGAFIDTFVPAGSGGLRAPSGLIFGPDGNHDGQLDLYLAEVAANGFIKASVKRYDGVSGDFLDTFVTERSGGLEGAVLITFTETDPVTLNYLGSPALLAVVHAVPEPTSLLLASVGAAGMALYCSRRSGVCVARRHSKGK